MDRDDPMLELKHDLQDGDDLAQALAFIGDVLHRRIRRVRRSLDRLGEDGRDIDRLTERVRATLDRYEVELTSGEKRLRQVIEEFQTALDRDAERIEEQRDDADGADADAARP